MKLIKKELPVVVETKYTIEFTHEELSTLHKAMGKTAGNYNLYKNIGDVLGDK